MHADTQECMSQPIMASLNHTVKVKHMAQCMLLIRFRPTLQLRTPRAIKYREQALAISQQDHRTRGQKHNVGSMAATADNSLLSAIYCAISVRNPALQQSHTVQNAVPNSLALLHAMGI